MAGTADPMLNAGLVRQVGFEYQAQADPLDWLLTAVVSTGAVTMTTTRGQHAVTRGGVILSPLTTPFTVDARSAAPMSYLRRVRLERPWPP